MQGQYTNQGLFGAAPSAYGISDEARAIAAMRYAPPQYSPFNNPAHVDNAFGYLANMYGPQLVQGMFGPDAFLMHQMPSQNIMDERSAAQYQRRGTQVISAAHMAGNEEVAKKLLAIEQIRNGGQPITQLDREHANTGASVLNNPIFKQFAASQIGADTYEGILFGSRGDPAAIASSAQRMGFYRADAATGDRRMSEDSLKQFSQSVYKNLYGPDANLAEMRGFGAQSTGEMMEHLFHRGRLPQALGALSPAERVKAMSAAKRDDATVTRMAEQFGHQDLMERDFDYANATEEERKIMLSDKMGDYKSRISSTFEEIDKHVAQDPRAKSISEIEQLDGFSVAANAVDATRTTKALKDYNKVIASIREIFGDNGQANAPVQELIASLEHLTGGSSTLAPGKLQSLIRQVRIAARDSSTNMLELNNMVREEQEMGAQMGLSRESGLERAHVRMLRNQSMQDAGMHEKMLPGKMQKEIAEQTAADFSRRGDASAGGQSLAVLNRLVSENPDKYRGTKMEAAVKAYRNNQEEFEYQGKKYNLAQMVGEGGVSAMYSLARESGASDRLFRAYQMDRQGLQPFVQEGYAYKGQTYMHQNRLAQRQSAVLTDRMTDAQFNAVKPAGMSDEEFAKQKETIAPNLANRMLDVALNETKDMTSEQIDAKLEQRGKEELSNYFQSKAGGGLGKRAADQRAETYFNALYGADAGTRKENMRALYTESSAILEQRTGVNIEGQKQIRNKAVEADVSARQKVHERQAERFDAAAMGTESTFAQRVGDELNNIASDNTRTRTESLKHVFNVMSEDAMLQKYAPDMQEGLVAAAKMHTSATVTPEKIQALHAEAQKDPTGPAARELKIMAGFKPDEELTQEQQETLRTRAMMAAGNTAAGATPEQKAQNEAQRRRATSIIKAYNTGKKEDVEAGARAMAESVLGPKADQKQIEAFAQAALDKDTTAFEKKMQGGVFGGKLSEEKQEEARAMSRALRASQEFGGLARVGLDQNPQTVTDAQARPVAQTNEVTRAASRQVFDQLEQNYDRRAYADLKPPSVTNEQFDARRKELMRVTAETASGIAVNEMGDQVDAKPEERAKFMQRRLQEEMVKHFEREGSVPARAEEKAKKHLQAVFGSGEKGVQQLNDVYAKAQSAAKESGLDVFRAKNGAENDLGYVNSQLDELKKRGRETGWITSDIRFDNKADQQRWEDLQARKKALENPEAAIADDAKMTPAQQKVFDEISQKPTADEFTKAMRNDKKREQLLSLPGGAARELFDKFSPEEQQQGLKQLEEAKTNRWLTEDERANVARIHKTLAEHQAAKTPLLGARNPPDSSKIAGVIKQADEPIDFDQWHGKAFKIVSTPEGKAVKSHTDGTPVANTPGQVSIVTPENGDAWNWPDAPAETVNNFRKNWKSIQGGIAGYKMDQIRRGMQQAQPRQTRPQPLPPQQEKLAQYAARLLHAPAADDVQMTPEQKKVVDDISKSPTADTLTSAMYNAEKRKQLLSLPESAAQELFDKFSPEDQQKGISGLESAKTNRWLSKDERDNASRLHKTLSNHQTVKKLLAGAKTPTADPLRHEQQQKTARREAGVLRNTMESEEFNKLKPRGMSDEAFTEQKNTIAQNLASRMVDIAANETKDMTPEEVDAKLEQRGKEELSNYFQSKAGGGLSRRAADAQAGTYFNTLYGKDADARKKNMRAIQTETNAERLSSNNLNPQKARQFHNRGIEELMALLTDTAAGTQAQPTQQEQLETVTQQMSEIESRGKTGWFTSKPQLSAEDQEKYELLQQQKTELESGDPLGTVNKQIAEIESRSKPRGESDKPQIAKKDRKQYDLLQQRKKDLEAEQAQEQQERDPLVALMNGAKRILAGEPPGSEAEMLDAAAAVEQRPSARTQAIAAKLGPEAHRQEKLGAVTKQMEEIASRGKPGWFTSELQLSKEDKEKYESLRQRKEEIVSGDPLGTVTKQMEEVASRGKSGWFTNELQLSKEDRKKYDALSQRRKELESGDPLGTVTKQMEEVASRGKSGWFTNELQLSKEDRKKYDALQKRRDEINALDPTRRKPQAGKQRDPMADAKPFVFDQTNPLHAALERLGGDMPSDAADAIDMRDMRGTGGPRFGKSGLFDSSKRKPTQDVFQGIGGKTPSDAAEPEWQTAIGPDFQPRSRGDQQTGVLAIQKTQAAFVAAGRETADAVQQNANQATRAQRSTQQNEQSSNMQLTGTLVLKGLSEAVMQASGRHMEQTPDGTPVDMGGGTGAYHS